MAPTRLLRGVILRPALFEIRGCAEGKPSTFTSSERQTRGNRVIARDVPRTEAADVLFSEAEEEFAGWGVPKCDVFQAPMLAIVSYPTLKELRANQDKPGIREYVERIDAGFDKFEREKLREPEQLPEINEYSFSLTWDFDGSAPNDERTLIKHGDTVIFSEPARWEEYERFEQVAEILKSKYGRQITDLVPTPRSGMWLYGDKFTAPDHVESVRDGPRGQSRGSTIGKQISLF